VPARVLTPAAPGEAVPFVRAPITGADVSSCGPDPEATLAGPAAKARWTNQEGGSHELHII
jgi:hypothetical protein